MVKENPKPQPNQSDIKKNILNILVIILICLILYFTRTMKDQIKQLQLQLANTKNKLSSQPIHSKGNIVTNRKNPNCPKSQDDYNSCLDKVTRCKQTQKQFGNAQNEFQSLIKDCAISNEKNQKINVDLEKQINELNENIKKLQDK